MLRIENKVPYSNMIKKWFYAESIHHYGEKLNFRPKLFSKHFLMFWLVLKNLMYFEYAIIK
jgi:hypothetical protein